MARNIPAGAAEPSGDGESGRLPRIRSAPGSDAATGPHGAGWGATPAFQSCRSLAQTAAFAAVAALSSLLPGGPALAGPVLCTTSLEAPIVGIREPSGAVSVPLSPVEVTRCGVVQTVPQLLERRTFSWTSPFARGVDMTHQVTDLFGIAMGGGDGTKVMGLGFGDQTLIWDGSAIENTASVLLEDQSNPMPLRTSDLTGVYNSSLGGATMAPAPEAGLDRGSYRSATSNRSVRGMW